jgi:hypothetical protein
MDQFERVSGFVVSFVLLHWFVFCVDYLIRALRRATICIWRKEPRPRDMPGRQRCEITSNERE